MNNLFSFSLQAHENENMVNGPCGHIETIIAKPENPLENVAAIICHPHPLHGGTMDNKIVTTLSRSLLKLNIPTARFNFRGVGKSSGEYDQGNGEEEDLKAIINFMQEEFYIKNFILAGFSFGSYISIKHASNIAKAQQENSKIDYEIISMISIGPPVGRFPIEEIDKYHPSPWLIVQGKKDEIVLFESVDNWIKNLDQIVTYEIFPDAGHFFHGELSKLGQIVQDFIITTSSKELR